MIIKIGIVAVGLLLVVLPALLDYKPVSTGILIQLLGCVFIIIGIWVVYKEKR
jgi:hypothetical protein